MHKLSSTLAFITNKIFIALLIITTLVLAQVVAVAQVITNKDNVKTILSEANLYQNLPENAIYIIKLDGSESEQSQQELNTKTVYQVLEQNGFINAEDINAVIVKVVSPDFLQKQTENLIDNVYGFLEGSNQEILFSFSLKDRADVAEVEISKLIKNKLASLPICSYQQLLEQADQEVNVLEATCLPPGVSLQSKIDDFTKELTSNDGIFDQEYTQKDVQISNVDANLAKYIYSSLKSMVWIFWLLVLAFSAVIVLTSKTLHRGLKVVGSTLAILGLVLLSGYLFLVSSYNFVDNVVLSGSSELSQKEVEALTTITNPILEGFVSQVISQITIISTLLIILGILLFVLGIFATKHHVEHLYLPKHKEDKAEKPKQQQEPLEQKDDQVKDHTSDSKENNIETKDEIKKDRGES